MSLDTGLFLAIFVVLLGLEWRYRRRRCARLARVLAGALAGAALERASVSLGARRRSA
jgi:hypothetical protein